MTARTLALVAASAIVVGACGGAAPPSAASPVASQAEPEPRSIEDAQAQIARASDELNPAPMSAPADATAASAPPSASDAPPPAPDTSKKDMDNACANPCRALASMRRAVDALCRMAGDSDKRCVDARQTLADNVSRTATCSCSR